jgi:IS5 family transposase
MRSKYRITNWRQYDRSLKSRGNVFLYFTPESISNWHNGNGWNKKTGRPRSYSRLAIETCLTLRLLLHLPLRQAEGFVDGIIAQLGLSIRCPDHSLMSIRAPELKRKLKRFAKPEGAVHVLIDSSGLKVYGEGEWKVRTHGKDKRRTWKKIHITIDAKEKIVLSTEVTKSNVHDSTMVQPLLKSINDMESFTGDGAYDTSGTYRYLKKRKTKPIIPPRENAITHKRHSEIRNEVVETIRNYGDNEGARKKWKQEVGYHRRSLVENAFFRRKTILGPNLRSRTEENQVIEGLLGSHILNKMTRLGMPVSVRVN